jgi:hypothetical protein
MFATQEAWRLPFGFTGTWPPWPPTHFGRDRQYLTYGYTGKHATIMYLQNFKILSLHQPLVT